MKLLPAMLVAACLGGCTGERHEGPADIGPASRIVTLAPHLTELVFTVGAGNQLVGVVAHSDYPEAAQSLPVIGDAFRIDPERLAAVEPDLVLAWAGGNPAETVNQLLDRGYRVVSLPADALTDVAANLVRIGALTGHETVARAMADEYLQVLEQRRRQSMTGRPLRVFYQISPQPLYTVGGRHPISEMIRLCGGQNVFADLEQLAPAVSLEAVLARDPQVIIAAMPGGELQQWHRWADMAAVAGEALYTVDASLVSRPSTRMLQGLQQLCAHLEAVRISSPDAETPPVAIEPRP
ncbi:MAG: cobalamin-binding protein [Gammaproteobacteria bacterium]|nr:cobalamin-binding protein [Gammaproteobacteria bacterium]